METQLARVLIVDDEPLNPKISRAFLEDAPYAIDTAENGEIAWDRLQAQPDHFDAILLDRILPRMDGMELLHRIRRHPQLRHVPVILQTTLASKQEVAEGLAAGARYCLAKPLEVDMLFSVLGAAVRDRGRYQLVQEQNAAARRALDKLHAAELCFTTLAEARDVASVLASAFPDPRRVIIGLTELLINAVEHGNLGISYEEKSALQEAHVWHEEIDRRLADARYADRRVRVTFGRDDERVWARIVDDGAGFDWRKYVQVSPERLFHTHGRGIALARLVSFDTLQYRGSGNEVEVAVRRGLSTG